VFNSCGHNRLQTNNVHHVRTGDVPTHELRIQARVQRGKRMRIPCDHGRLCAAQFAVVPAANACSDSLLGTWPCGLWKMSSGRRVPPPPPSVEAQPPLPSEETYGPPRLAALPPPSQNVSFTAPPPAPAEQTHRRSSSHRYHRSKRPPKQTSTPKPVRYSAHPEYNFELPAMIQCTCL
jgi:hypothetical protein